MALYFCLKGNNNQNELNIYLAVIMSHVNQILSSWKKKGHYDLVLELIC